MNQRKKPLSPHLQIYKPQITSFTSILHRATGIFLYFGIVVLCWAMVYYTYQIDVVMDGGIIKCECFWTITAKYILYLMAIGLAFSLYYHLFNGIRHLLWDIGKGFKIETARKTGWICIIASVLMTAATVCIILCL